MALTPLHAVAHDDIEAIRRAYADARAGASAFMVTADGQLPDDVLPEVEPGVAVVVQTSGSTDHPKRVALTVDALEASAAATREHIGAARWILAVPTTYIAGLMVVVRSILDGRGLVVLPPGRFTVEALATAVRDAGREHPLAISLVPAQLATVVEAMESDRTRWAGLADIDTILVGGQALAADLRARASDLGLRIVRTYGSAETAGGVVYGGRPIGDTVIESVDGILHIASSSLARGYLNDDRRTAETFVTRGACRWFRTTDVGTVVDGVVTVMGRADDIIISGGIKVSLAELERLVQTLESTAHATWFAEPTWGQVPAVVSEHELDRAAVRDLVEATLGKAARPYRFVVSPIPRLESGKPDRRELFAMVERATD